MPYTMMRYTTNSTALCRQTIRATLVIAVIAVMPTPSIAQTAPPTTNTKPLKSLFQQVTDTAVKPQLTPPDAEMTSEQTIAEIEALRKRMGGGVGEQLKNVLPGIDPNENFRQQLENLTRNGQNSRPTKPSPANPTLNPPSMLPSPNAPRYMSMPTLPPAPLKAKPSQQHVLRSSAAELERIAATMEAAQLYQQADQLRSTAETFWQKARSLDQ